MPVSHVIGFDDAPFDRGSRGDVPVVGVICAGTLPHGVLVGRVRRDGANAAARLAELVVASRFAGHLQLVMLQGIALAGFNVVDVPLLFERTGLPVLVVARRAPDVEAIRRALLDRVPGGGRKWRLVRELGPMEPLEGVHVQRHGLSRAEAAAALRRTRATGLIPEPLRLAHLVAGALVNGQSRGRA